MGGARAIAAPDEPDARWGWTALPDVLLQAAAVRARAGRAPDDLAGLRILDDDAARLLAELAGDGSTAGAGSGEPEPPRTAARTRLVTALRTDSPFAAVVGRAGLGLEEAEVLALLCAVELDPRRQRLVAYLQDDVTATRPTLHLLRTLFGSGHLGALAVAADARLRRAGLVVVPDDGPWASRQVAVPASVVWSLLGDPSADPALPVGCEVLLAPDGAPGGAPFVAVAGDDRVRRLQAAVVATAGERFLVTAPPGDDRGWEAVVRQATIGGLGVVVEVDDELPALAARWIDRADHLAWCVASRLELPVGQLPDRPWVDQRSDGALVSPGELAQVLGDAALHGHRLRADQLRALARTLPAVGGDLDRAVRRLAAGPLEGVARRIRPQRSWDDLVLRPDQRAQLGELVGRYRRRDQVHGEWSFPAVPSAGLVALFSGPSGTGKTTAAEIVAGDLGVDLFKVDLSAVVSKYIGETEKNLERVFDAAAAGNLVLLFDEADALFGKRTEVSDARDRYANVEVSYLLQRLEAYDGLVVLTTNFQKNIDQAFLRRVHVAVDFPLPDVAERRGIWAHCLSTGAPVGDVDVDFLAERFELPGGTIRNAALTAAFLAADAGTPITMELVVHALKRELQKLGRLCTEGDFGPWYPLVAG